MRRTIRVVVGGPLLALAVWDFLEIDLGADVVMSDRPDVARRLLGR